DDISVKAEMVTETRSSNGYDECRLTIINRSPTKSHRVTVVAYRGAYFNTFGEIRRVVEAAPSSAATISMFRPQSESLGGWFVTIDGQRQRAAVNVDTSRTSSWTINPRATIYLMSSRDVEKIKLMDEAAVVEGFKNAAGESEVAYLSYKSPISEWSGNW